MRLRACILASFLCLAGCAGEMLDPFQRPGTWNPSGANEANLRAMVADPADLQHGRGSVLAIGETAATAVEQLRDGTIKPLPQSGVAEVKTVDNGTPSGNGGAAPQ